MRRLMLAWLIGLGVVVAFPSAPAVCASGNCVTIQSGEISTSAGVPITPGFDEWGYNYGARLFNGGYCDAYRNAAWCQPWKDDVLEMKWNDAWISDSDCDGDGLLDRHFGFASYRGSGAWLTNHIRGSYVDARGKKQRYVQFTKIVAAPLDATKRGGTWFAADGSEIGPAIWGDFAILMDVYNDTGTADHGVGYLSPYSAGFGRFTPHR